MQIRIAIIKLANLLAKLRRTDFDSRVVSVLFQPILRRKTVSWNCFRTGVRCKPDVRPGLPGVRRKPAGARIIGDRTDNNRRRSGRCGNHHSNRHRRRRREIKTQKYGSGAGSAPTAKTVHGPRAQRPRWMQTRSYIFSTVDVKTYFLICFCPLSFIVVSKTAKRQTNLTKFNYVVFFRFGLIFFSMFLIFFLF